MKIVTMAGVLVISIILSACQSYNAAMSPDARTIVDDFDGSKVIRQDPVSAASSLSESWHTLGFEWVSKWPDKVFLTVGVHGIENVFNVQFNVGGEIIKGEEASYGTDYGDWSSNRFIVSYFDFEKIATAPTVKMKVSTGNSYGVSSFGGTSMAVVNSKFQPFLNKINQLRRGY